MPNVYIVECSDGSFYTGWTTNLEKRMAAHNNGSGARYTRSRRPVILRYAETVSDKSAALKREYQLRKMKRVQKQALADHYSAIIQK
jgi:putative endonuclease